MQDQIYLSFLKGHTYRSFIQFSRLVSRASALKEEAHSIMRGKSCQNPHIELDTIERTDG